VFGLLLQCCAVNALPSLDSVHRVADRLRTEHIPKASQGAAVGSADMTLQFAV